MLSFLLPLVLLLLNFSSASRFVYTVDPTFSPAEPFSKAWRSDGAAFRAFKQNTLPIPTPNELVKVVAYWDSDADEFIYAAKGNGLIGTSDPSLFGTSNGPTFYAWRTQGPGRIPLYAFCKGGRDGPCRWTTNPRQGRAGGYKRKRIEAWVLSQPAGAPVEDLPHQPGGPISPQTFYRWSAVD